MNGTPAGQVWKVAKTYCRITEEEEERDMKRVCNLELIDMCAAFPFRQYGAL